MTQEKKQEFTLKISQANKTQMITIIYEIIIDYLDEAMDCFGIGKKDEGEKALLSAQNCIDELLRSLNLRMELGKLLHQLYIFSKKELIVAGVTHSMHKIWRVEQNFKTLHEGYMELEKLDSSEPMMDNTQKVYAGLTYGRYSLNENMALDTMNRGFMA